MLGINQKTGFDCPSCAWADPDGNRNPFEFCENGAKAMADEATTSRIRSEFFARYSIAELGAKSDYWLNRQGRLASPVILRPGDTHYRLISWDDAFQTIAKELKQLGSPDEAVFYTSGKATNEAAFLFQPFARLYGTNNLPDCSNMCHESSGWGLNQTLGVGKSTVTLSDPSTPTLSSRSGRTLKQIIRGWDRGSPTLADKAWGRPRADPGDGRGQSANLVRFKS